MFLVWKVQVLMTCKLMFLCWVACSLRLSSPAYSYSLFWAQLGATAKTNGATNNFAGLAIGLSLVLVHLVCIRYTGTSVNPARSLAPAIFQGGTALANLWIFIVGPFVGGALAACIWKVIEPNEK